MPAIIRNGRNYSGGGSDITKEDIVKMGFYELPEGGIPAEDLAEGVIPTIPESLPASDVPSWAKQPTKPSYTASEVGALSADGKAADSDKLDGHDSGYFATATAVTALSEDVNRHAFGSGSGGKNIWNEKWDVGDIDATVGQKYTPLSGNHVKSAEPIEVKPNTIYTLVKNKVAYVYFYDANLILLQTYMELSGASNRAFTTPTNTKYIYFEMSSNYGTVYNHDLAIIEGDNLSAVYEPYVASNAQLMEAIDESEVRDAELRVLGWNVPNGMSLKNTVENGVFTQKVGRVALDSLPWEVISEGKYATSGMPINISSEVDTPNVFCGSLTLIPKSLYKASGNAKTNEAYYNHVTKRFAWCLDVNCTTTSALLAIFNGKYLYYELAEYKTYTLADYPSTDIKSAELQALGWCVPSEMPVKNSFANGVLTQYVGRLDLSRHSWTIGALANGDDSYYTSTIIKGCKIPTSENTAANIYLIGYVAKSRNAQWSGTKGDLAISIGKNGNLFVNSNSQPSNGCLYFELATPIQHTVTDLPTQKSMLGKEWDSTVEYKLSNGDKYLIHENSVYEIIADNQNMRPDLHPEFWKKQTVFDILANMSGSGFP